jgi:hypothetical protein
VKKAAFAALLFTAGLTPGQTFPSIRPVWISVLPEQKGRVYAMGLAPFAPAEAQAIRQAQVNARVEVLTRLRANVKGETSVQSRMSYSQQAGGPATATSSKSISQDSLIQTQATELPGLVVEETWSDAAEQTAYALAYLDVPVAERELKARFEAVRKDLAFEAATPTDPRERLRTLQRMKKSQSELAILDDLAGLISAGGSDPVLRSAVRDQRLAVDRRLDALRGSLTLCLKGDQGSGSGADVASLVRNAVLRQGLGWSEGEGEFTMLIRRTGTRQGVGPATSRWWDYQPAADFIVARGVLEITLTDRNGAEYESTVIEAKGVGVSEFQADRALMKDYKTKLEAALGQWLENLVH